MIKQINRRFLLTVITYILYFVGGLALLIYGYIATDGSNWIVTLAFVFFIAAIFVTSFINNRLLYYMNLSYIVKIQENSGDPIQLTRAHDTRQLLQYLESNGFKKYGNDEKHYTFIRIKKDHIKRTFRTFMLEMVVYINKDESDFYLDIVSDEINKIKDDNLKDGKKITRVFVTQVKEVADMEQSTKDDIREVVFIRSKHNIISTVNVGLYNSELGVLLYSDTYSPSLYYQYHIQQIKNML